MSSLLLVEARQRAELVTVTETVVELDLNPATASGSAGEQFASVSTVRFDCSSPGAATFVDFAGAELISARLNGAELARHDWTDGRIALSGLSEQNELVVQGLMRFSNEGEGMCRHVDPADGNTYLYAMSFLDAAPKWFACFDQPDLKSRYRFDVRAPQDWTVHGNGPAHQVEPGHWTLQPTSPLSTYFVTLIAGPWASIYDEYAYPGENGGIPLGVHVRASLGAELANEVDDILTVTRQCFDYYHQLFGVRYPFGEYHQAFVPDFNAGAMENPGCVTFRDQFIFRAAATDAERGTRAGTIAHEMAHMWFGNLVTMRWWDDLWLNESFAEYMAHRACAEATRYPLWTDFGISRKVWGMVADQSPSTHPVAGNGAADAQSALAQFDGISYAKGASVLKQLVGYLDQAPYHDETRDPDAPDGVFLSGLRAYFGTHAHSNATFADLLSAWTTAGAHGLTEWAQAWLRTSGMDVIDVRRSGRATDDDTATAAVHRTLPAAPAEPADRPHAITAAVLGADGSELSRCPMLLTGEPVRVGLPEGAVTVVPDAGDDTWAQIRMLGGWSALPPIGAICDELTRTVCYKSIFDGVRQAELAPATALGQLLTASLQEPADQLVRSILQFGADHLVAEYSSRAQRSSRRAQVTRTALELLAAAAPGTDRQLICFRIVLRTLDDRDRLRRWLDGDGLPDGLALDRELRWSVVTRLVLLGDDPSLIDAASEQDRSAAGRVHAARARALVGAPSAKQAAFDVLMAPSGLSAYELYAVAEGFFCAEQTELTGPWVEQYFDRINDTAGFRSGWSLARVALMAFPLVANDSQTLRFATETLAREDLDPQVRRSLVDATDQLARAVAAVRRFE